MGSGQDAYPPVLRAGPLTCQASSSCVSATFWRMARISSRDTESRSRETRLSSSDSFRALRIKGVENMVPWSGGAGGSWTLVKEGLKLLSQDD